jgi:homoserine O-acetyltransferase
MTTWSWRNIGWSPKGLDFATFGWCSQLDGRHAYLDLGEQHPDFMDALVPMAAQPTGMSGRNWMMRRMLIESIRQDAAYDNGNYAVQPASLRLANVFRGIGTSGGTLAYQALAPTREQADKLVDERLAALMPADPNDFIYQWEASRDYDPAPGLERIAAPLLAINAADDERNPPETGLMAQALARVRNGHLLLIPAMRIRAGMALPGWRNSGSSKSANFWPRCQSSRCEGPHPRVSREIPLPHADPLYVQAACQTRGLLP